MALFRSPVGTLRRRGFGGSRISPLLRPLDSTLVDIADLLRCGKKIAKFNRNEMKSCFASDGLQKWDERSVGLINRLLTRACRKPQSSLIQSNTSHIFPSLRCIHYAKLLLKVLERLNSQAQMDFDNIWSFFVYLKVFYNSTS